MEIDHDDEEHRYGSPGVETIYHTAALWWSAVEEFEDYPHFGADDKQSCRNDANYDQTLPRTEEAQGLND